MSLFYLILFIVFVILILKMIKTELPKRLKKEREIWELEKYKNTNYEINTINSDKGNLYNTIKIEKTKKEIFEENRRKRAREHYINTEKKGKEYELHVAEHFRKQGYKVKEHGLINGRADSGIDVIAMKDKEITLIQCKNWKKDSKYKVDHNMLKAFIGNTTEFLEKNKDKADGYSIKRLFVTSNDTLDESARHFIKDSNLLEHKIIPIEV